MLHFHEERGSCYEQVAKSKGTQEVQLLLTPMLPVPYSFWTPCTNGAQNMPILTEKSPLKEIGPLGCLLILQPVYAILYIFHVGN